MHQQTKNRGNQGSNTIKDTTVTLCLDMLGGVMHDCASVLDSIAKGISLFLRFFAW